MHSYEISTDAEKDLQDIARYTLNNWEKTLFKQYQNGLKKNFKALDDYKIYIEIEDGKKGIFDMKPYLNHGIFKELNNPFYFNQVGFLYGAVTWPHEQDIAPETLIAEMKEL